MPFSPLSIGNCAAWFDASDSTTITQDASSNVSQWNDKTGNGLNAIVNTAQERGAPTYNGSGAIKYVSLESGQALVIQSFPYNTAWSVFSCMCNVSLDGRWYISPYNDKSIVLMGMSMGANKIFPELVGTGTGDLTGSHIEYTTAENTNGIGAYLYYRDGTMQTSNNTYYDASAGTVNLGIGANGNANYEAGGTYYPFEIIIYNQYLGDTDRQKVEGYLAWKWGLQASLPSGHPYLSAAP